MRYTQFLVDELLRKIEAILDEPVGSGGDYPPFSELGRDIYPSKLRRIRQAVREFQGGEGE